MLFGFTEEQLDARNASFTAKEIAQQPDMWLKIVDLVNQQRNELKFFLKRVTEQEKFDVLMVGAGTSDYVGRSVSTALNSNLPYRIRCCATTDLVVDPEKYLTKNVPTLLVSFARSGNSPESVGAVDVANKVCDEVYHLFITCNKQGALAQFAIGKDNCFSFVLPSETNDRGFAMTSSFSGMYLASLLIFQLDNLSAISPSVQELSLSGKRLLEDAWHGLCKIIDEYDFERIVYLGCGVRKSICQEAALKMLELNAGKVSTFYESPLGFRHGPKSIINDKTLTVLFESNDDYAKLYEQDLIKELDGEKHKNRLLVVYAGEKCTSQFDYSYNLPCLNSMGEEYHALLCVMFAQIFAFLKSLKNGITPDNPCPTGEVNRVVKGVTIYPYVTKNIK